MSLILVLKDRNYWFLNKEEGRCNAGNTQNLLSVSLPPQIPFGTRKICSLYKPQDTDGHRSDCPAAIATVIYLKAFSSADIVLYDIQFYKLKTRIHRVFIIKIAVRYTYNN